MDEFTPEQIEVALKQSLLSLCDLDGYTTSMVRDHLVSHWEVDAKELEGVNFIVAYESVGDYGCDPSAYFVFQKNGKLFEVYGSHCSCYGFEDQWRPGEVTAKYLTSSMWRFYTGGYDDNGHSHSTKVKAFLMETFSGS